MSSDFFRGRNDQAVPALANKAGDTKDEAEIADVGSFGKGEKMDVSYLLGISLGIGDDEDARKEDEQKLQWIFDKYDGRPLVSDPTKKTAVKTFHINENPGGKKTTDHIQVPQEILQAAKEFTKGSDDVGLIIRCHWINESFGSTTSVKFDGKVFAEVLNQFVDAGIKIRKQNDTSCFVGQFSKKESTTN